VLSGIVSVQSLPWVLNGVQWLSPAIARLLLELAVDACVPASPV
jgi:hypothetical protein